MSYKKSTVLQKSMTRETRIARTNCQAQIMLAAVSGKRIQVFAQNGAWLTANMDSGFGTGWNWTANIYRVHPDDDIDRINECLFQFYVDPAMVKSSTDLDYAKKYWDKKHLEYGKEFWGMQH